MATYDWAVDAFWGSRLPEPTLGSDATSQVTPQNIGLQSVKSAVFVVFDLETTGLEPKKERIVEIGAIKFDQRGPIGRFSVLVNPGVPMPPEASKINGITDTMLMGKPSLDEVLPDFVRFIADTVIIAHNAPFDCSFIDAALAERYERDHKSKQEDKAQGSLLADNPETSEGNAPVRRETWVPPFAALPNRVVDTRIFAKDMFPGRWKYSLQELAKYFGIEALDAHRAEDDARVCMELFLKCVEKAVGKDVPVYSQQTSQP